jgi:hypothetical protein
MSKQKHEPPALVVADGSGLSKIAQHAYETILYTLAHGDPTLTAGEVRVMVGRSTGWMWTENYAPTFARTLRTDTAARGRCLTRLVRGALQRLPKAEKKSEEIAQIALDYV